MELIKDCTERWNDLIQNYSDPRTEHWFMLESFKPAAIICILYVIYVHIGQFLMTIFKIESFRINKTLITYNVFMTVLSGYMVHEFLMSGWLSEYSLQCQPVDYSNNSQALRMASVCWVFYISKFIEFADSLFLILHKKNNKITFLHVFSHGVMPASWWFIVRFVPGGFSTFHALIQSIINLFIYLNYALTLIAPHLEKYLWWKKSLINIQTAQFFLFLIHSSQLLFIENCDFPILFVYCSMLYALIFIVFIATSYWQEFITGNNKTGTNLRKKAH